MSVSDLILVKSLSTQLKRTIEANFLGVVPTSFLNLFSKGLWLMNSFSFNSLILMVPFD